MTRRNLELVLLCIGAPIVILMFAMLALNQGQRLGLTTLGVPIALFAAFVIAHLAARRFTPDADPAILPIVTISPAAHRLSSCPPADVLCSRSHCSRIGRYAAQLIHFLALDLSAENR